MTLVTATVEDIVGAPDNTVWHFSSLLRQSDDGGEIITPRWSKYTPAAGVLALDLEPGFAAVAYRGKEYVIEVPASGTADLWDLLAASSTFPPGTPPALVAQAVMGWIATHLDDAWDGLGATTLGRELVSSDSEAGFRSALGFDQIMITDVAYGGKGDAVALTDAAMTSGSAVCTSASNAFAPWMVGKTIIIRAGVGQAPMTTTVASYQNAGQITLAAPAAATALIEGGPNVNAIVGTDNSAAFAAAFTAAAAKVAAAGAYTKRYQTVAQVYVPAGSYLTTSGVPALQNPGLSLVGAGANATRIWHCGTDAFLQMGTFASNPSNTWVGVAERLRVSHLTLAAPIYAGMEGSRLGTGIQDNGSGRLFLDNVYILGFKYGVLAAYGSDFSTLGPNAYFTSCDVGVYWGPGSEQILMHAVDFYRCLEGLVNEGAPHGALIACSFEDNKTADITYDGNPSGTTRSGVPWNVSGANYYGAWSHTGCWFETGAGGADRNNDHSIWIKSTAYSTLGWRGLSFRDCFLVSGGRTQVPGGTNSFITDVGTKSANPIVDGLSIVGKSINGIYYYNGAAGTSDVDLRDYALLTASSGIVPIIGETDLSTVSNGMSPLMTSREITLDDVSITNSELINALLTNPKVSSLLGSLGNPVVKLVDTASAVNWVEFVSAASGSGPQVRATSAGGSVPLRLRGQQVQIVDGTAANIAQFIPGAGTPTSYLEFGSSSGGAALPVTARTSSGSEPDVSINMVPRGAGVVQFKGVAAVDVSTAQTLTNKTLNLSSTTLAGTTAQFNTALSDNDFCTLAGVETLTNKTLTGPSLTSPKIDSILDTNGKNVFLINATASAVNYFQVINSAAGGALRIFAIGSDTNININLVPKGTGVLQQNGVDVATKLSNTATLDFPSVAAQSFQDLTITVTGAATGDTVALGTPTASITAGVVFSAWVSATNTVTVRAHNYTAGALDPASGVFKATVIR